MNTERSNNASCDLGVRRSTRNRKAVQPFSPSDGIDKKNNRNSTQNNTESNCSSKSHSKNRSLGCEDSVNSYHDKSHDNISSGSSTESDSSSTSGSEDNSSDSEAELSDFSTEQGKRTSRKRKLKPQQRKIQPPRKKQRIQKPSKSQFRKRKPNEEERKRKKEWFQSDKELKKRAKEKQLKGEKLNHKEHEAILRMNRDSKKRKVYRKKRSENLKKQCEEGNEVAIYEKKKQINKQVEYNRKSLAKRQQEKIDEAVNKIVKKKIDEAVSNALNAYKNVCDTKENDSDSGDDEEYGKTQFLSISRVRDTPVMLYESLTFDSYRNIYCQEVRSFKLHESCCDCKSTKHFREMLGPTDIYGNFLTPQDENLCNAYAAVTDSKKTHNQLELEREIVKNVIDKCSDNTITFSAAQCVLSTRVNRSQNGMMCIVAKESEDMDVLVQLQQAKVLEKKRNGEALHHDHVTYTHAMSVAKMRDYYDQPKSANNTKSFNWLVAEVLERNKKGRHRNVDVEIGHHLKEAFVGAPKHLLKFSKYILITIFEETVDRRRNWKVDIPGGKRKLGETPHNCALRETNEETSIVISEEIKLIGQVIQDCNLYVLMNATDVIANITK